MKILVFGSSSTKNFQLTDELKKVHSDFRDINVKAVAMSGATITGFGKRNSSLNVRQHFIETYNEFKPDYVCFALGQTDIELGIYYKKVVKNQKFDISEHIKKLSEYYLEYILGIQKELNIDSDRIIIKGINPPVITRYKMKAINYTAREILRNDFPINEKNILKEKLKDIYPSVYERYNYHKLFNKEVSNQSKKFNINKYFDVDDLVADPENTVHVKLEFIAAGMDHHIIDSLFIRKAFIQRLIHTAYNLKTRF